MTRGVSSGPAQPGRMTLPTEIIFPRQAARDLQGAMDQLLERFPDHEPRLVQEHIDSWLFGLVWRSDQETIDPSVVRVAEELYGLKAGEIGGFCRAYNWRGRSVVFSLVHAWALIAPAAIHQGAAETPINWVIHVDDHTDLMELIVRPSGKAGALVDQISDAMIYLNNEESITSAIWRGALHKGNFLTAFVAGNPDCKVVHVKRFAPASDFALLEYSPTIEVAGRGVRGYGLRRNTSRGGETAVWFQRRSLPRELPLASGGGVWLDIDMDFFCNRWNGDSDRRGVSTPNAEAARIDKRIGRLLRDLSRATWLPDVLAVSVAVSPGFFPSEYWRTAVASLENGLKSIFEQWLVRPS